jgi:hypothetical protein
MVGKKQIYPTCRNPPDYSRVLLDLIAEAGEHADDHGVAGLDAVEGEWSNSTSGTVQVRQSGVWSNAVPFSVTTAAITGVTPDSGVRERR